VPIRLYFRTRVGLETPDATVSIAPFLYEMIGARAACLKQAGITMNVNVLRSESTGSIHIKSRIRASRRRSASTFCRPRTIAPACWPPSQGAGADGDVAAERGHGEEIAPGAHLQKDDELLDW